MEKVSVFSHISTLLFGSSLCSAIFNYHTKCIVSSLDIRAI